MSMSTVNVRYMVDDVATAVAWYTKHLGFTLLSNAAPAFADVTLGSLIRHVILDNERGRPRAFEGGRSFNGDRREVASPTKLPYAPVVLGITGLNAWG